MRLIVCSDSHGRWDRLAAVFAREREFDFAVFLGDGAADTRRVPVFAVERAVLVRGNCDPPGSAPPARVLEAEGFRVYCTHGYLENVKWGRERLIECAKESGCALALFGHTHMPLFEKRDGVYLFNPGALHDGVYGVADLTPDGTFCFHKRIDT